MHLRLLVGDTTRRSLELQLLDATHVTGLVARLFDETNYIEHSCLALDQLTRLENTNINHQLQILIPISLK